MNLFNCDDVEVCNCDVFEKSVCCVFVCEKYCFGFVFFEEFVEVFVCNMCNVVVNFV